MVLVSHNMAAVNALCSRCIEMQGGSIVFDGPTAEATTRYYVNSLNLSGTN